VDGKINCRYQDNRGEQKTRSFPCAECLRPKMRYVPQQQFIRKRYQVVLHANSKKLPQPLKIRFRILILQPISALPCLRPQRQAQALRFSDCHAVRQSRGFQGGRSMLSLNIRPDRVCCLRCKGALNFLSAGHARKSHSHLRALADTGHHRHDLWFNGGAN